MQVQPTLRRRIGIIGFGQLGQYLVAELGKRDDVELCFVWNRNKQVLAGCIDDQLILDSLEHVANRFPDLVVEVAHPAISSQYAAHILQFCDYMIGSPTALSDALLEHQLKLATTKHALYIPAGAMWGAEDIKKMADRSILQAVSVTMSFHPESLKLVGELKSKNDAIRSRTQLYKGPVRQLCQLAPNNVNTMAAAAIAAHNLGFDGVQGCLISDATLTDYHIVEISVDGKCNADSGLGLNVCTIRRNPASRGRVTGSATLASFLSSVLRARDKVAGIHLC